MNPDGTAVPKTANLVLIGSRALLRHVSDSNRSYDSIRTSDYDYVATFSRMQATIRNVAPAVAYPLSGKKWVMQTKQTATTFPRIAEFEVAWSGSTAEEFLALASVDGREEVSGIGTVVIPSLNLLYALKLSHRYLKNSPHFLKTMRDIQLMRKNGAWVPSEYVDWLKRREAETYAYGHPKLNQDKTAFFSGDGIDYIYDHDDLHEAVKIGPRPAYTLYQTSGEQVKSSRRMFEALPHRDRINGVIEEASVLALERSQIPYPDTDPRKSYEMALMKVCTSITSGWFREFAWENYDEALDGFSELYVARFQNAVDSGWVKRYYPG